MYARIGTFDVPAETIDRVVELFRTDAVPLFRTCEGFLGYRAYVDRARGRLIGISLWTTREALEASTDKARGAIARGEALGALHGVPVTVKVNVDCRGRATTNGIVALRDAIATEDSPVVANLRRAGAVIFGRTNTPAFS